MSRCQLDLGFENLRVTYAPHPQDEIVDEVLLYVLPLEGSGWPGVFFVFTVGQPYERFLAFLI